MEINKDNFNKFTELVKDQFSYGGKKYALAGDNQRESTDILFDKHGKNWLFGTIDKYTYRFKNLARERDLLKIATYMYILWLKRGFYIVNQGVNDPPIDTNLKVKNENFNLFVNHLNEYLYYIEDREKISDNYNIPDEIRMENNLNSITSTLEYFSSQEWKNVKEADLANIFLCSFYIWDKKFSATAGTDTDTWNENKNGK